MEKPSPEIRLSALVHLPQDFYEQVTEMFRQLSEEQQETILADLKSLDDYYAEQMQNDENYVNEAQNLLTDFEQRIQRTGLSVDEAKQDEADASDLEHLTKQLHE